MKMDEVATPVTEAAEVELIDTSEDPVVRELRAVEPWWVMPTIDLVLAFIAFAIAYFIRYELQVFRPILEQNNAPFNSYLPYAGFYGLWLYINYRGSGLYRIVRGRPWMEEVYTIINGVANATLLVMAISFVFQPKVFSRLMIVYVAGVTVVLLALARVGQRWIRANLRKKGIGVQRVLLVGVGDVGQSVLRTLIARKEFGYLPIGFLDDNPNRGHADLGRLRGLGTPDNLAETIKEQRVQLVIITLDWSQHSRIVDLARVARNSGADVRVVPDLFQMNLKQVQIENLAGVPLLGVRGKVAFHSANRVLKRAMDLTLILLVSPILLLIFIVVSLAIRLEGAGEILYSQKRVGENGREFHMFKFRSMIPDAERYRQELVKSHELDPRHPKIPDDPRITRVGRFIRRTSIDELPNLINVVNGHMSLVGPRPPTPDEVELYEPWHMQRLQIMPGITGLWQINGRSDVPFEEMCLLDIYYIENWSIKLDIQILMMTFPRVVLRQGAY